MRAAPPRNLQNPHPHRLPGRAVAVPLPPPTSPFMFPDLPHGWEGKFRIETSVFTMRPGFAVIVDYTGFSQDAASVSQVGTQENQWAARAARLVFSGTIGGGYKVGYLIAGEYEGFESDPDTLWSLTDLSVTFPVHGPATKITVGKTKETFGSRNGGGRGQPASPGAGADAILRRAQRRREDHPRDGQPPDDRGGRRVQRLVGEGRCPVRQRHGCHGARHGAASRREGGQALCPRRHGRAARGRRSAHHALPRPSRIERGGLLRGHGQPRGRPRVAPGPRGFVERGTGLGAGRGPSRERQRPRKRESRFHRVLTSQEAGSSAARPGHATARRATRAGSCRPTAGARRSW
ncbi:MAG: hypothetical protein MZV64_36320 [Ignavibacteriales bacterium]|nr:hypothetical protein [Ignavibacteriales bacterium]